MRIFLGIAIIVANLLMSREIYLAKRKELVAVEQMISVIQKLITYINYGSYDVYQMCEYAFADADCIKEKYFSHKSDIGFAEQWRLTCGTVKNYEGGKCFCDVASFLGLCDSQSQMKRLEYTLDLLIKSRNNSEEKLYRDKKLIYSLGCFVGVTLCLMLV